MNNCKQHVLLFFVLSIVCCGESVINVTLGDEENILESAAVATPKRGTEYE